MNFNIKTCIVVNDTNERIKGNTFVQINEGIQLYPFGEVVYVVKKQGEKPYASAIIKSITLREDRTELCYELIDLGGVN